MTVFMWIAVALVIGLLIGFVTLSVLWTARAVEKSICDRSLELMSAYDELLEARSRELSALDAELEDREKELAQPAETESAPVPAAEPVTADPTAFLKAAEQLSTTQYQDGGAGEAYQRIRQTFSAVQDETVRQLTARPERVPENGAGALLRLLPFDTVYQISTLPDGEQLRLLRETIPAEMRDLLENYAASVPRFDCIGFYDALKAAASSEPQRVRLRIAPQDVKLYPASLDVSVDESICEGFQVEMDNTLYDYAIKTREIG